MCQYHSSDFYPRPPCGGRLQRDLVKLVTFGFLSTPSVRRATFSSSIFFRQYSISIHALRAEGDPLPLLFSRKSRISIHALRAEGDARLSSISFLSLSFLSTPSVRRATRSLLGFFVHQRYFYPRPPCGGRPICRGSYFCFCVFLSTPSVRRATGTHTTLLMLRRLFLSTPSVRRATEFAMVNDDGHIISIHALRAEGD